jgi:hypothetical protein
MKRLKEVENQFTYSEYVSYVEELFKIGLVTGDEQIQGRLDSTELNLQRMNRLNKHFKIEEELESMLKEIERPVTWYVISEGWCGDAAQNLPVLDKLAESSDALDLKIILRDENPEIMNQFLTNGSKSIPKLVAVDTNTDEIIGTWGPRPAGITAMVQQYKIENPVMVTEDFHKELHLWYGRDKGRLLQADFKSLLEEWNLAVCPSCN